MLLALFKGIKDYLCKRYGTSQINHINLLDFHSNNRVKYKNRIKITRKIK